MATMITSECINCGACEGECPNTAIYQGGVEWESNGVNHPPLATDIFYIVPEKCTECVGFHDQEACAAVCPVDCCVPNPDIPETEEQLIARSRQLHPETEFPADFPSRFRKQGAQPAAVAKTLPAAPKPVAPPAAPAAPVAPEAVAVAAAPAAPAAPKRAAPPAAPAAPTAPEAVAVVAPAAPKPAAAPTSPVAPAAPEPAAAPAAVAAGPGTSLDIPSLEEWEVPIDCFRCGGSYTVPFKHVRSGVVLYCPSCNGSYVVSTSLYGRVSRALIEFNRRWMQDLESFQERRRRMLGDFNKTLRRISTETKPPGAPKKRAWIFG